MKKETTAKTMHADEKALNLFTEMMIKKIESLTEKDGWKKPWFTEGAMTWPKNLNGRSYNGMNALVLIMHCENNGYKIPRFCTFDCVQRLNEGKDKDVPRVFIKKGEKSFPVMITTFTCVNKETKERIKYDDFRQMTEEQRKEYSVYPKLMVYRVFNVDQTNMEEARPEMYAKFKSECMPPEQKDSRDMFSFEPVDFMIDNQAWICPIEPTKGDEAYFQISKNKIVVPLKEQFKDGESFYSNLFHEMAHSTGHESQLGRLKPAKFGSEEYAREELVAELTAALVSVNNGITKNVKDDSAAYLKSWLNSLKEDPSFIKTVLLDVKKAAAILNKHIEECAVLAEKVVVA